MVLTVALAVVLELVRMAVPQEQVVLVTRQLFLRRKEIMAAIQQVVLVAIPPLVAEVALLQLVQMAHLLLEVTEEMEPHHLFQV